jgi:hypothetical protein
MYDGAMLAPGTFMARFNRMTINVLALVFLIGSLSASAVAFFYPLEIETRESTVWLHVLALKHGVNIYDHTQVSFVNMNHGPFDPLFKLLIATLFPFFESWQVVRFPVLLLPYIFLLVAWKLLAKPSLGSFLHVVYMGSIGYLFLVLSAKEFLFIGRSDATAALLLLVLTYLSISFAPKRFSTSALYGFVWGSVGIFVILSNWRMLPIVFTLLLFSLWMFRYNHQATARITATYVASCACAAATIFGVLLYHFFGLDVSLYYKHFFGFYSQAAGWASGPYSHKSVLWFLGSLFKPTADPESLKGGPLLLALIAYLLVPGKADTRSKAWLLLGCFVFAACATAYYLNYYGGGQWYFIPFLIILWFFLCTNYRAMPASRLAMLGIVIIALLFVNVRTVIAPSLWRASTLYQAYDFMERVRSLEKTNTVLSEDTFFFRTSYQGELIDMGDTNSVMSKSGYYGEEFNRTVKRHFDQTQSHPPDYIVTGFTESPELRGLIEEKYILIAEGPNNLTANGFRKSKLLQRKDLMSKLSP